MRFHDVAVGSGAGATGYCPTSAPPSTTRLPSSSPCSVDAPFAAAQEDALDLQVLGPSSSRRLVAFSWNLAQAVAWDPTNDLPPHPRHSTGADLPVRARHIAGR
jgi:hypothetical protein